MARGVPDFSSVAKAYAATRPRYPQALYDWLCSQLDAHDLAWDTSTGNGQAALGLASRFTRVAASDISMAQVAEAVADPRVHYFVGRAEAAPLRSGSADLVVAAAAAHWFDLDRFGIETQRVVRSGGLLAAWTYHVGHVHGVLGVTFQRFLALVRDYFGATASLVDARYETLSLPGERIAAPPFEIEVEWTREQVTGFVRSWSGVQKYLEETGVDPIGRLDEMLDEAWPADERVSIRWPIYMRVSRL